jgi:carboxypeptidase Q
MYRLSLITVTALALGCSGASRPASSPAPVTPPAPARIPAATGPAAPAAVTQLAIAVANDPSAIQAIAREGLQHSHIATDLQYLADVIGPRLTGSGAMRRANDWTAQKFREYGMDSVWLEPWQFGQAWERGPMTLAMLAPQRRQLIGFSWAWAPGTNGPVAGRVVYVDATNEADFQSRFAGKIAGAWVMTSSPATIWNPDGIPPSARDSAVRDSVNRASSQRRQTAEQRAFQDKRNQLLAAEGIAGLVGEGSKEFALLTMSGSPNRIYPFPSIVVAHEVFTQFHRLLAMGEAVRIEANIQNTLTKDSVIAYNTLAEIRGSEHPEEVVLLGAHLDSWDLGTGTTDNGTGSMAVLEAARILKASGVKPKRTIRFALFSGEEEGLIGSKMYARAHDGEMARFQAVAVLDNGTGRITGMALQGRDELNDLWKALFSPVGDLGPFTVRSGNKGGTDHLSFLPAGVPGFNYDQESRGYGHTHHSEVDTFDHAVIPDLQQAATVMAATAYELANLPQLLPRNPPARTVGGQ